MKFVKDRCICIESNALSARQNEKISFTKKTSKVNRKTIFEGLEMLLNAFSRHKKQNCPLELQQMNGKFIELHIEFLLIVRNCSPAPTIAPNWLFLIFSKDFSFNFLLLSIHAKRQRFESNRNRKKKIF